MGLTFKGQRFQESDFSGVIFSNFIAAGADFQASVFNFNKSQFID